jgi:hypothetical protein
LTVVKGLFILLFIPALALPANHYVTPSGNRSNTGADLTHAWSLSYAMDTAYSQGRIAAGDTVYVYGGTYMGRFYVNAVGTHSRPIVFRSYQSQRVQLNSGTRIPGTAAQHVLTFRANAQYCWVWGFEVTTNGVIRVSSSPGGSGQGFESDCDYDFGIAWSGNGTSYGCKIINCIVHACGDGVGAFTEARNAEIYGTLAYNSGWMASDGGAGHGTYCQNTNGTKLYSDCIFTNGFGWSMQFYGSCNGPVDSITVRNSVLFGSLKGNYLTGPSGTGCSSTGDSLLYSHVWSDPAANVGA